MRRFRSVLLALVALAPAVALTAAPPALAQALGDEVIVRFDPGTTPAERSAARQDAGVRVIASLPVDQMQTVSVPAGETVGTVVRALQANPDVRYAEPSVERHASLIPNDPYFGYLYGLFNRGQTVGGRSGVPDADVDGTEAYDVATGSPAVPVAVVDSGVALAHPDLAANAWVNPGEAGTLASNGRDDDANGYIDDVNGWDFVDNDNRPDDANGHGTHVAGTVAARAGNDAGVAGAAPTASIMALRVLDAAGSGRTTNLVRAYQYAARKGVRVVNLSLGGASTSRAERDALTAASNTLFVTAAGNGGPDGIGDDNDLVAEYPCVNDLANVICVAATDQRDALADFSNFGSQTVDLGAPGVSILSTLPAADPAAGFTDQDYGFLDGTSMATPHVSGAAALLAGRDPAVAVTELRRALLSSVDPLASLAGRTATGGRLNARRALETVGASSPQGVPVPVPDVPVTAPAPAPIVPAPIPPPPRPTMIDRTAPVLSVDVARRRSLSAARRRALRVRVRCSELCSVGARLTVSPALARRLGLRAGRDGAVLGSVRRGETNSATLSLRVGPTARRRLTRVRSLTATLRVRAADRRGNPRTVALRIVFRSP